MTSSAPDSEKKTTHRTQPPVRKLWRRPKTGKIAGVCSGLAEYFAVDVTLLRVGGHFDGSTAVHWKRGPRGATLLPGDALQVEAARGVPHFRGREDDRGGMVLDQRGQHRLLAFGRLAAAAEQGDVALAAHFILDPFFAEFAAGVDEALAAAGFVTLLGSSGAFHP